MDERNRPLHEFKRKPRGTGPEDLKDRRLPVDDVSLLRETWML